MHNAGDSCKQWASKAVAFVVKHSEAGIVSLCTNVAAIMEEQNRLAKENERLSRELQSYKEAYGFPPGHEGAESGHPRRFNIEPVISGGPHAVSSSSEPRDDVQAAGIAVPASTKKQIRGTIDIFKWDSPMEVLVGRPTLSASHITEPFSTFPVFQLSLFERA